MGGRQDILGYLGTSWTARTWLSLDTCGFFGVSLSWGVHLYALAVIATNLLSGSLVLTAIYLIVYVPISCLAMVSLFKAWTTDPGAVPLGARPLVTVRQSSAASLNGSTKTSTSSSTSSTAIRQRAVRRCHKCNDNFKPARAHHDSVTGRCIVKFDHFCPWVGNAVGAKNHKFFCLFLFYTALSCLLSLLFLLVRAVHCGYVRDTENNDQVNQQDATTQTDNPERGLLSSQEYLYEECNYFYGNHIITALFLASLIFLIFTCSMGCEQLEAIETGKSKIARMKMRVGRADTEYTTVTEEFNEMFGGDSPDCTWHWFWPSAVAYPRGMEKVVLGYEWDATFDAEPFHDGDSASNAAALSTRELQDMEGGLQSESVATVISVASTATTATLALSPASGVNADAEPDGIMLTRVSSHSSLASAPTPTSEATANSKGMKNRRFITRGNSDNGLSFVDHTKSPLT